MRLGAGDGRTRADHLDVANQMYAAVARAREAREFGELVGEDALSETDRRHIAFGEAFENDFVSQGSDERRDLDATLDRAWGVLSGLPRRELTMIDADTIRAHYGHYGKKEGHAAADSSR